MTTILLAIAVIIVCVKVEMWIASDPRWNHYRIKDMIKKWIIKIFKINTYEKEYKKYKELYQNTLADIEVI